MRKFQSRKKFRKHGFFHKHNPFNTALRNRLNNTLGTPTIPKNLFLSPLLNQGDENICSEVGSYAIRSATTGKSYIKGAYIASEQSFTNNGSTTEFDAQTVMNTAILSGLHATDGTKDQPDAVLWVHPNNAMDLYDSIIDAIAQNQKPAGLACQWFSDWETGRNGVVPFSTNSLLGGHWTMLCGKVMQTINSKQSFPETDRLCNQGSWGEDAPGSDKGLYYFSRNEVNSWLGKLGIGVWIDSEDRTVQILGKISALYVKIIELLHIA